MAVYSFWGLCKNDEVFGRVKVMGCRPRKG